MRKRTRKKIIKTVAVLCVIVGGYVVKELSPSSQELFVQDIQDIPEYQGKPYIEVNGNVPYFEEEDFTTTSFEIYSDLDALGRCQSAYACIGQDLMPQKKKRKYWASKTKWVAELPKYDEIDGKYLYNRCHLIGYQLSGENANKRI